MIKTQIPDKLLMEWFTKSLLPPISRDVAMVGVDHRGEGHFACPTLRFDLFSVGYTL
jgi:hypothetical protein